MILSHSVLRRPDSWNPADPGAWSWDEIPSLPPFQLADGSGPAAQQTRGRLCWDDLALHVRFDCEDRDAWGTYRRRNDPIYQEEAVEVFLAPGGEDPVRYFDFEVSPLGTLFDATIHNPTSRRADMTGDPFWDCPGLRWGAGAGDLRQDWWAWLAIPWRELLPAGDPPRIWRANFYRIERPRDGEPEFSGWSPTWTDPADFHKPARFGLLELAGGPGP
ncbi:MAG TPA: carbohydrate-binding family 9-like protein [Thermoanaerobaculia bacterium]|jgi:hypothetical protein